MTTPLEQLREACKKVCDESIALARLMGAGEHMRVAASIKDKIDAIDLTQFERGDKQEEK